MANASFLPFWLEKYKWESNHSNFSLSFFFLVRNKLSFNVNYLAEEPTSIASNSLGVRMDTQPYTESWLDRLASSYCSWLVKSRLHIIEKNKLTKIWLFQWKDDFEAHKVHCCQLCFRDYGLWRANQLLARKNLHRVSNYW